MKKEMEIGVREKLRERLVDLPDFAVDFLYLLENSKEIQTRFEYAKDIRLFLEFLVESKKITKPNPREIDPADLDTLRDRDLIDFFDYMTSYRKTYTSTKGKTVVQRFTNAPVGKSRKLATLHKLFAYLFKKNLISKDITQNVEIKVPHKVKIDNRLNRDEMQRFFVTIMDDIQIENNRQLMFHQKVKFRDYIITLLLAYTGIRVSECVQLDINEVYLQKSSLIVTRKGGDQQAITLPDQILEDIQSYIDYRKKVPADPEHKNALFISLHKKRIDPKTIRAMLDKYRTRSGIQVKITPHVFRRTFGTTHYNTYEDMYLTAQILGHSSAETTRKFYADPSEERVTRSMRQFTYGEDNEESSVQMDQRKLQKLAKKLGVSVEELMEDLA